MTREMIEEALKKLTGVRSHKDLPVDFSWVVQIVAAQQEQIKALETRLRVLEPKPSGVFYEEDLKS